MARTLDVLAEMGGRLAEWKEAWDEQRYKTGQRFSSVGRLARVMRDNWGEATSAAGVGNNNFWIGKLQGLQVAPARVARAMRVALEQSKGDVRSECIMANREPPSG